MVLVALGGVGPKVVQAASEALRDRLQVAPRVAPSLDAPQYAFNKERKQYHAASILRRLASLRGRSGLAVGIVDVDLFHPEVPYLIGDADRDAGAAVFSIARLSSSDPEVQRRRVQVEAIHSAGYLLGLSQCSDFRCAMSLTRDAADSDRKEPAICASCRTALGQPAR